MTPLIAKAQQINLSSLTLKEKIAQMIIIRGDNFDSHFLNLGIGGIFLDKQKTKQDYKNLIQEWQSNSKIKLFVSTDMEGAWNPFKNFQNFPNFSEIKTKEEAYNVGLEQGKLMKELGFNLNFAPVAEFQDKSYGGRAFSGTKEEIKEKLKSYIKGLQKNVYGTCKHYPGKGMIKNLHIWKDKQKIGKDDLELFNTCINENISSIMIGHQIVFGEIDSKGKQSTISKPIISNLRSNFSGLIITDEINMLGLKFNYLFSSDKMYIDLIKAGNDVILDFSSYKKVEKRIKALENAVKKGEISEKRIDESVKRILEKKRYSID